jgi:trimethylamine:corrinoid methyltransferase-like protein
MLGWRVEWSALFSGTEVVWSQARLLESLLCLAYEQVVFVCFLG